MVTDCECWVDGEPLYELGLYSLSFLESAEGCEEEWTTLMSGSAQEVLSEMGPEGQEVAGWTTDDTRVLKDFRALMERTTSERREA